MAHDYCICGAGRGSCIDCAENKIDRLTEQLADRDTELKRQTEIVEDAEQSYFRIVDKYNSRADQILQLQTENATLREEVERLNKDLGWANKQVQLKDLELDQAIVQIEISSDIARQDAAREILNDRLVIACIAPDGIVHKQLLKKYELGGGES